MDKHIVVGVHIIDREKNALSVQEILTGFGSEIKTRLGLHDDICPENGLILLEMADTPETCTMISQLEAIKGVDCKSMIFDH